jgi:hypothetical protein
MLEVFFYIKFLSFKKKKKERKTKVLILFLFQVQFIGKAPIRILKIWIGLGRLPAAIPNMEVPCVPIPTAQLSQEVLP